MFADDGTAKNEAIAISCCVDLKTASERARQHADSRRANNLTCDISWGVRRKSAAYRQAEGVIHVVFWVLGRLHKEGFPLNLKWIRVLPFHFGEI